MFSYISTSPFMYNSWIFYHVKYLNILILTLKQGSIKEISGSCCGLDMEPRKESFMVIYVALKMP